MRYDEDPNRALGARLREADPVSPPPREAMWSSIEFARRFGPRKPGRRAWPIGVTGIGLAASLVLGISIGRMTLQEDPPTVSPATVTAAEPASMPADETPAVFRLVAEEHMARAQVLLTGLDEASQERPDDMAAWARSLLVDTRLLLESPVASDPDRAGLLLDLELVLAQIAALPPADPDAELEIIRNGIRQTNVLARLRTASDQLAAAGM